MKKSKIVLLLGSLVLLSGIAEAGEALRPRILGLPHVAYRVDDMPGAIAFYTDFFGYEVPYTLPRPTDRGEELVWIKINDRQSVELFPGSEVDPESDRMYHFAVETDDADAMRLYLRSKGYEVPDKTPVGKSGNKNFTINDPVGNRVEFVEYLPDGWTMQANGKFMSDRRVSVKLQHVGIKVGNLEAALEFYGEVLGFKEVYRQSSNGEVLSWVNMQVPDGDEYIEFMLYGEPPSKDRLRTMHHICLEVDDIMSAHRTLETRTLPAGCRHPTGMKLGKNGKWQINYFDPDGTRVEIMEPDTFHGERIPDSDAPPPCARAIAAI